MQMLKYRQKLWGKCESLKAPVKNKQQTTSWLLAAQSHSQMHCGISHAWYVEPLSKASCWKPQRTFFEVPEVASTFSVSHITGDKNLCLHVVMDLMASQTTAVFITASNLASLLRDTLSVCLLHCRHVCYGHKLLIPLLPFKGNFWLSGDQVYC